MTELYHDLVPILAVDDLDAEHRFYETIGFEGAVDQESFPDFVLLSCGPVAFGLQRNPAFDVAAARKTIAWQLASSDIAAVADRLEKANVSYEVTVLSPEPGMRTKLVKCRTPNGYVLLIEGDAEEEA